MTDSTAQTLEGEETAATNENPNNNNNQQHDPSGEWQPMARAWVSAFPEGQAVTASQVEVWLDSNFSSLPADLQSMPRSDIIDRLLSIQDVIKHLNQEKVANQVDPPARFQRTDQWIPVYSWLESLDHDEVVKSKDISDWLNENPLVKDQLCSRHSRYHLMHYIKKCHLKILKRREKKGSQQSGKEAAPPPNKETAIPVQKTVETKQRQPPPPPSNPLQNIPKDSEMYVAKRSEALRKYEILVELEKKLAPMFPRPPGVKN